MVRVPVPPRPPSPAYVRYVLGLLFVVNVFNFIDRQILAILLEPIKEDLGVTDSAMGFLTGIAFALFYTAAGIPIARLADRGSRRTVIAIGLTIWSAMTAASGLARSFAQLAAARIGVGIGEAACTPPAHSLLADYFPPERRSTALAVYGMGVHVGILFGFVIGGVVNELYGWRNALYVVGLPGLLLAALVALTVREPLRGAADGFAAPAEPVPFREAAQEVRSLASLRHMALGAGLHSFAGYALAAWGPAFMVRVHHMGTGEVGATLGLITGVAGAAGAISGGLLADRLGRRDPRWTLWVPAIASLIEVPLIITFLLVPSRTLALVIAFPGILAGAMWLGPVFAGSQNLVRPALRAFTSSLMVFVINLIGLGLGPQAVGLLNDGLGPRFGTEAIRYSLCAVALANAWAAAHWIWAARTLREDLSSRQTRSAAA
jgi:predicted MFS family arabinose efflux permease